MKLKQIHLFSLYSIIFKLTFVICFILSFLSLFDKISTRIITLIFLFFTWFYCFVVMVFLFFYQWLWISKMNKKVNKFLFSLFPLIFYIKNKNNIDFEFDKKWNIKKYIQNFFIFFGLLFLIIVILFAIGTFLPNPVKKDDIYLSGILGSLIPMSIILIIIVPVELLNHKQIKR
ncbi:hypothetical protein [Mycoplasma sp. AC157]